MLKKYLIYGTYLFLAFFCFISFFQTDLIFTSSASNLLFFQNYNDFYDSCKFYLGECHYFPSIYFLFYLWSIPLNIFLPNDITHDFYNNLFINKNLTYFFLWNKFLLVICFALCSYFIFKITKLLNFNNSKAHYIFLLCPICFFSVFIFSGYDILLLFIILLSIYFYIKDRIFVTFFLLSLGVTLKFFAIPFSLALLAFSSIKNTKKIIIFCILLLVFLIELKFYSESSAFIDDAFQLVANKSSDSIYKSIYQISLLILFSIFLFALQFSSKLKNKFNGKNFFLLPICSLIPIFIFSPWSPHWLILILPFIYLHYSINFSIRYQMIIYYFINLSFFFILPFFWFNNIDSRMIRYGVFGNSIDLNYSLYNSYFLSLFPSFFFYFLYFLITFFLLTPIISIYGKKFKFFLSNKNYLIIHYYYKFLFFISLYLVLFFSPYILNINYKNFSSKLNSYFEYIYSYGNRSTVTIGGNDVGCQKLENKVNSSPKFLAFRVKESSIVIDSLISNLTTNERTHISNLNLFYFKDWLYLKNDLKFNNGDVLMVCFTGKPNSPLILYTNEKNKVFSDGVYSLNGIDSQFDLTLRLFY